MQLVNYVGDRTLTPDDNSLEIKDYLSDEILGSMPNIRKFDFLDAIGISKQQAKEWGKRSLEERISVLQQAGASLKKDDSVDILVAKAGLNPVKWIKRERLEIADWLENYGDYLRLVFGDKAVERDLVKGLGFIPVAASSTSYATQPYVTIEAIGAGNSVNLKLDSTEPFSGAQVAEHLREAGAPIQTISYDRKAEGRGEWGNLLFQHSARMPIMGSPESITGIVYGPLEDKLTNEFFEMIKEHLHIPEKVVPLTTHGGLGYIDQNVNLEDAIKDVVESSAYQIRVCKRMRELVIHPEIYDEAIEKLSKAYSELIVGPVDDYDTEVPKVTQKYWDIYVDPYIRSANGNGSILLGGKLNEPTLLENPSQAVTGSECLYAVLGVRKGNLNFAFERVEKMADHTPHNRILEFSVFTQNPTIYEDAKKNALAYNIHHNEPTTKAIGLPHEGKFLVQELSYIQGAS
ncbi:aldehyde dehydrogenase family protein [Candidatus Woesearchaeota archaeon]|nr:aldehyde dehydrogenase family protein [Candidatus Woesearchaeota archaeon]